METLQDIHIEEQDGHFVATVAAIDVEVTGKTHEEALQAALRAIITRRIAEAEKQKRERRGKDHTGA